MRISFPEPSVIVLPGKELPRLPSRYSNPNPPFIRGPLTQWQKEQAIAKCYNYGYIVGARVSFSWRPHFMGLITRVHEDIHPSESDKFRPIEVKWYHGSTQACCQDELDIHQESTYEDFD